MTPDQIAGGQATPLGLMTRLLDKASDNEIDYALVSGSRRALRFLADLLNSLADSPSLPADFSLSPDSAGNFHFDPSASLGLYLECASDATSTETVDSARATVWIFHGDASRHASAVFRTEQDAQVWIEQHSLSGLLTEYPVGDGCYDIAVREARFNPSKEHHGTSDHVAGFSPGWTRHVHFENGHS